MPNYQSPDTSTYTDNGAFEAAPEEGTEFRNEEFMISGVSPIKHSASSDEEDFVALDKPSPPSPHNTSRCRRMIPLAVGLAALTAVGLGIYFFMDNNNVALSKSGATNPNYQGVVTGAELAAHNTADDCWVLIGTTVYDLTDYAPSHPGGSRLVTDLAGTDATKEYELEHPLSLMRTLPETIIGTIDPDYVPVYTKNDDDEFEDDDDLPFVATATMPPVIVTNPPTVAISTESPVAAPVVVMTPTTGANVPVAIIDVTDPPDVDLPIIVDPIDTAFISEIHYDNIGGDEGQMIEIAYSNQLDVSGYKVEFYRGKTGKAYNLEILQAFAIGASVNGLTFASRKVPTFQNGVDGVALVDGNDVVVEFISYEGIMTAQEGYAAGMTSVEMNGAFQSGQDPVGWTLQKTGTGCRGDEFTWGVNAAGTPGDANVGMTVECYADGVAVPAPAPWAETLSPTATCFADHFDLETVARHGTTQDCWHAIFGVVYEYTAFINEHTGGPDDIVPNCGTDATEAYRDRHSRGLLRHSVKNIIGRVGEVEGSLPVSCERRLEHADSGYWDDEWESVEEFENYVEEETEDW